MLLVALIVIVVAAGAAFALRPAASLDSPPLWLGLALPYLALVLVSLERLRRDGQLRRLSRIRPGDLSVGVGVALLLLVATWLGSKLLMPADSPIHGWVLGVFAVIGDASSGLTIAGLVLLAGCEELVWRGLVQTRLSERLGARRGWVVGAALYALAHAPTLLTLRDPVAGPNPTIVLLSLGCGLCWAFLRERTGRLWPAFFSHAAFTYLATQFPSRFL